MSRTSTVRKPESSRHIVRDTVAQAGPLASKMASSARQGSRRSRAWAAPQVERTSQFLQEVAAPKISAALSSAARKIEPAKPRHRRWGWRAGMAGLIAAAGAVTAVLRSHQKPAAEAMADEPEPVQMDQSR
jgi:hypothetical protein